jgi:hypothetical protein
LAELGFFVKEMNTGWTEWQAAGLPTHGDEHLAAGVIRCGCSLHGELVAEAGVGAPAAPH